MGVIVSKFIKKRFIFNVPVELHREFLLPFRAEIDLDLDSMSHVDIFEFYSERGNELPAEAVERLHNISDMASPEGYNLLISKAEQQGTQILPLEDEREPGDLDQNEIAFLAALHYESVFEQASRCFYHAKIKGYSEYNGIEEIPFEEDEGREILFKKSVEDYFNKLYKGPWCEVSRFVEDENIHYIICHGKFKSSIRVIEEDGPRAASYREEKQDALIYIPTQSKLLVSASSVEERKAIAHMFASIILNQDNFFDHEDSENNCTLEPLKTHGLLFKFDHNWDPDVHSVAITEIQFSEGKRGSSAITFRSTDVLQQLSRHGDIDIQERAINYINIRFVFLWKGKKKSRMVKIKPPSVISFDRRLFAEKVLTHLRRNRFVYDHRTS